jgi:hypothetical protein
MKKADAIQSCRNLLRAVSEMHKAGRQLIRVCPCLQDSAGGGRWFCAVVPAELTSRQHGARLGLFQGCSYPYVGFYMGEEFDSSLSANDIASMILLHYPLLAQRGRGSATS